MTEASDERTIERRSAAREPIHRRVVFSGVRGEGILRQGLALDISADGLLIHTTQPDVIGRHLEVELHPGDAVATGHISMVRAEVAWVRSLPEKNLYAMGLRFLQAAPPTENTGARYHVAGLQESARIAEEVRRSIEAAGPGVELELSAAARNQQRTGKAERRKSRILVWLLLLLLFALLIMLLTWGLLWRLGIAGSPTAEAASGAAPEFEIPGAAWAVDGPEAASADQLPADPPVEAAVSMDMLESGDAGALLSRGGHWLAAGDFPAAARAFASAREAGDATPVERYLAELGEAEALARSGRTSEALALLERPFGELAAVPAAWRAVREAFRDGLILEPGADAARAPLARAFDIAPAGELADAPTADPVSGAAAGNGGARIEVDTANYLLTVLVDDVIEAVYPVGLGAQDRTRPGEYTIVNKIRHPDWYNGGDVVPAGDPENPLGSRWLGLGDESGPTPLGIHGTADRESIGGNLSRGCIRMRPSDVEALFDRIPIGTPVTIRAR